MRNMLDALLPRTRQAILATLLLSPERRWYLSDLAQLLRVSASSLQREPASLAEAEILCRETDGNRVYYRANPAHPLLPELQGLFAKTTGLADKVRAALKPFWDEIELAFIFDSVARGERTAASDTDVLVVGSVSMAKLALPLRELERTLQIPVNVTHYTAAEFREKRDFYGDFLRTVWQAPKILLKGTEHELADTADGAQDQDAFDKQARAG